MLDIKDNSILIMPNNLKEKFLINNNKILNLKFFTINEFKKNYFYDYDTKTIYYIMTKYNKTYDNAYEILKNTYYIENKKYINSTLNYLVEIKNDLINNNLLKFNNLFKKYINTKNIYVFYDNLSKNDLKMFDNLNVEFIKNDKEYEINNIYEFENINDEVNWCSNKICELIENGIDINKIKLITFDDEYKTIIYRIFKIYNIPIQKSDNYLISTKIVKYFLENIEKNINNTIELLKNNYNLEDENIYNLYKQIIDICNKYNWCDNFEEIKELLIEEFKSTKIKPNNNKNIIEIIDFENIQDNDNIYFLLGFNQNVYPKTFKDDEYINDSNKKEIFLETTKEKNNNSYKYTLKKIKSIKNIFISYKLHSNNNDYLPSIIIDELNANIIKNENINITYSNIYNKQKLTEKLDYYLKYGKIQDNLEKYYNTYNDYKYKEYNNQYKKIDEKLFKKYTNNKISISYTNLNNFYKCQFKYYIENILKISNYEETFTIFIGNIFHYVLSKIYDKNFDFNKEFDNYLKNNYELKNNKEKFFINKLKKELEYIVETIKKQEEYTNLNNKLLEHKVSINFSKDDYEIIFNGIIDKIMYETKEDKTIIAIIDYKTGNPNLNLNNIIYGLDMQLCVYAYLTDKIKDLKNPILAGIYLQKILNNEISIEKNKTYENLKYENLKLQGYSNDNEAILKEFDKTYSNSNLIKSMKLSNKGFYAYSKTFNKEMIEKIKKITENKIKEAIDKIINQEFEINPKKIGIKNLVGCEYCKYKDICYMKNEDIINLKEYKKLEFLGGEEN